MGESFQAYSKTSKIGTSIFQNTCKLEVNIRHAGFEEEDLFMIYFNNCL